MKQLFIIFWGLIFGVTTLAQPPVKSSYISIFNSDNDDLFLPKQDIITEPPSFSVRSMAEWEELEAIAVTWDLDYSYGKKKVIADIISYAKEEVQVLIFCSGKSFSNVVGRVKLDLQDLGFSDFNNLIFNEIDFDERVWIRDFGAHTIYKNDVESRFLIDWLYPSQFENADEKVSSSMSSFYQTDLFATTTAPYDLRFDGGNLLTDGLGMAITSSHIYDDNIYDESTIDSIMKEFLGFENFIKLQKLPYDEIHHVDMHMRLLDEETILVGEFPEGVADGPQIEENLDYLLSNFKTSFGTDFKIHRIPMPADKNGQYANENGSCSNLGTGCYYTYTNAFFINELILVPTYFDGKDMDEVALNYWQELMPGYKIVGINCSDIIKEFGAIHCVTKEIGVAEPLRIIHKKLETSCENEPIKIEARLQHKSDIKAAQIFFSVNGASFQSVDMNRKISDNWEVELPAFSVGTKISYYINATANNGKTINRPMVGERGAWKFEVDCTSVSTQNRFSSNEFEVYPNPTKESFQIKTNLTSKPRVSIFDYSGKAIRSLTEYDFQSKINTSNLSNGIYLVKIDFDENSIYKKLIIND